jgi:hypothetical protein
MPRSAGRIPLNVAPLGVRGAATLVHQDVVGIHAVQSKCLTPRRKVKLGRGTEGGTQRYGKAEGVQ